MFIVFDLYVKGRPNALISIKRQGFRVTALWVYLGQADGEGAKDMAEFWTFPSHQFFCLYRDTSLLHIFSH